MEMTYGGALVMPSSYAMMDEEEMMYLEGGSTNTFSYKEANSYLNVNMGLTLLGSILGYVDSYIISTATAGLSILFGSVGLAVLGSCLYSWSDAYGNALIDLKDLSTKKKVQVKEVLYGLTLRVTVKNV